MESAPTTSVQTVLVRAVGEITGRIDVTHAGTAQSVVSLFIGTVLVRIGHRGAARRITETWREGALHLNRLPEHVSPTWVGPEQGTTPVGVVLRVEPDVPVRQDLAPRSATLRDHLRVQVGPVVWQVMDRTAYESMRELWESAQRQL